MLLLAAHLPAQAWEVQNLACSYDAATPGALTLTWDPYVFDGDNNKGPTDYYWVFRYTFRGGLPPKDPKANWAWAKTTRHVSTGLEDGVTYRFSVQAYRARLRPDSGSVSEDDPVSGSGSDPGAIIYCVGGPQSNEEPSEPSASAGYAVAFPSRATLRVTNLSDAINLVEFEFRDQHGNDLDAPRGMWGLPAYATSTLGEEDFGLDRAGNPTVTVWLRGLRGNGFAVSAYTRNSGGLVFLPVHRLPPE